MSDAVPEPVGPHEPDPSRFDIHQPWDDGNQEWWDWYVSLAENSDELPEPSPALAPLADARTPSESVLVRELETPYALTPAQVAFFQRTGYIKLRNVFSKDVLLHLRSVLKRELEKSIGGNLDGGVRGRFLSLDMVWLENELVRRFVLSPRIGQLAAELLEVSSVRLYHDNVMSKEPECGRTPWHVDDHHFPLATDDVVTVWIPVQPVPRAMGPLAFAESIDAHELVASVPFSKSDTSYDRGVADIFDAADMPVEDGPFDWGEISFHHNLSCHTAAANQTERSRIVLSNTYFADGARLVDAPTMVSGDWQKFAPGVRPGEPLDSAMNPVCWPLSNAGRA